MPKKPTVAPDTFTLLDPGLRAKVDAFIARRNAENPQKDPLILAVFLRGAIRTELSATRGAQAILDEALLADLAAHIATINASHPDDPYDLTRFVRVTLRKAMRAGHPLRVSGSAGAPLTSNNKRTTG